MGVSRVFLSHSSKNDAAALALAEWMRASGWDDLFLDLDPDRGITAGERWERALNEAAQRCEAVIFLISADWLASSWCRREFQLAQRLNKRIFGVLIEDIPLQELPRELTDTWQLVSLASGNDHGMSRVVDPRSGKEAHVTFSSGGLRRLKAGLERSGLDPRFFTWPPPDDPDRAPYRGLRALEAEDAGIFFGREGAIIQGLDSLRGLRDAAPPRFFVILGASGAGKSSFLRAGLIPRLQRDDRHFLPLPVIRPERSVLHGDTGLVRSLSMALKARGIIRTRAAVRDAVAAGSEGIRVLLAELADAARVPSDTDGIQARVPAVVLAVDQAEELFHSEGGPETSTFFTLLRELCWNADPSLIVIFTIRSDAYDRLQDAPELEALRQEPFSLPPLPRGAYKTVIEGPAQRFSAGDRKLIVDPALTDALLADVEQGGSKDALPLIAFTLERLYHEHGDDGDLRLDEYEALGRIQGSIDAAVARVMRAADADSRIPREGEVRKALVRRGLIPWLAGIDPETGAPRRRIARWSEIPDEARPLIEHLVNARLLSTDTDPETGERTVEPAHEALLRQWGLLQGWLAEAFSALMVAEGVKRASRDWLANERVDGWLAHSAGRLEDAEALRANGDMAAFLTPDDWAYLSACRNAEDVRRDRELQQARALIEAQQQAAEEQRKTAIEQAKVVRRTRLGLATALFLSVAAGGLAWWGFDRADDAEAQRLLAVAEQEKARAATRDAQEQAAEAARQAAVAARAEEAARAAQSQAESEATRAAAALDQALSEEARRVAAVAAQQLDAGRDRKSVV